MICAENTFTFQNMNIERGLLFAQEPTISRGGQLGYTQGVGTSSTTSGLVFGPNGTNTTQTRGMIEVGILF